MKWMRQIWRREQYSPGILGVLMNPYFYARRGLDREMEKLLSGRTGDILDVGCGRKPYKKYAPDASSYVGLDLDTPVTRALGAADVFYDGSQFPFADSSFDLVICSQVLEHVFEPERFLCEIRRCLREGGELLLTVPFIWDEHEQPRDFGRYTSFGLAHLLSKSGFSVVSAKKSVTGGWALVQLFSGWLYKATRSRSSFLNVVSQILIVAPVNLIGGVFAALGPRGDDLFLDNIVLARSEVGSDRKPGGPSELSDAGE